MDAHDFNFAHSLAIFASTSKTGEVFETRDVLVTNTRAPVAAFNQGVFKTPGYKFERTLERVRAYQARAGVPLRLHLASEHASVAPALLADGYVQTDAVPAMGLGPIPDDLPAHVSGLDVRRVETAGELEHFGALAFGTFEYPVELAPVALTPDLLALPHAELYVGYIGAAPVCCSMLLVTGHVAGIYWVGVTRSQRRRGLGAAITAHAVRAGKERGCALASLQASPLGAPVYRRIGFQSVREYLRFDRSPG
jgi:GNAT superfamily N-acetyltransferase